MKRMSGRLVVPAIVPMEGPWPFSHSLVKIEISMVLRWVLHHGDGACLYFHATDNDNILGYEEEVLTSVCLLGI